MADMVRIESLLASLLAALKESFSEAEASEVSKFIDAREYGLALETVVDIFGEESKTPPPEVIAFVRDLAKAMAMEPASLLERMRFCVK